VALVAAFSGNVGIGSSGIDMVDPGPLYGPHAGFAPKGDCGTCHEAHGASLGTLIKAVVTGTDMTDRCLTCHVFSGDARGAHNTTFAGRADVPVITCTQCHAEHKGAEADLTAIADVACATCHARPFDDFASKHPPFPETYPYAREASVKFDHVSHINKHFSDAKVADLAPKSCAACHDVTSAAEAVLPRGYAETCDACHGNQIAQRDMVLLRLPELAASEIDAEAVREACGPTLADFERLKDRMEAVEAGEAMEEDVTEDEFESVSLDEMTPLAAYLLDVPPDDMEAYGPPMQELVMAMAEEGPAPLLALLEERFGEQAARMLAGLNPELVKRVACAWAANIEYEPPADAEMGGWFGDYLELRYRPFAHGSPVTRAWLEAAISAPEDDDNALAFRDALIDPKEGIGACTKCHAVKADADTGATAIAWRYATDHARPYHRYSHLAHLNLVQASEVSMEASGGGCQLCHRLDAEADFQAAFDDFDPTTFASNFAGIRIETCAECHGTRSVRADCQLCHRYHPETSFKPSVMGSTTVQE
jgi:predicted CXXCH cytochrome family protein